ncbi:nectin-1-like isoform X2 [Salminus brasiliensis]|uniref:nectin-1-like isoform X2 n=1 Tax=Salminus brasiliensis TaxID=930266 RepID=UPI003B839290
MNLLAHRLMVCLVSIQICSTSTAIKVIGQRVTFTAGEEGTLFCQLVNTSEQLTRITWQKRTPNSPKNENIFAITPDGKTENINGLGDRIEFIGNIQEYIGSVRLKNVNLADEGIYTCIFNIFPSGPFEREIPLTVHVRPVVSVNSDVIPVAGDSEVILVTCTAKAQPEAHVSWNLGALSDFVKVETTVSAEPDGLYTVKSRLIGVASRELNQQKVQCLVNHPTLKEELILDYALVIHYPPQIVYIVSVNVPTASQEFRCVADANPQPTTFTWSRVNKTLSGRVDNEKLEILLDSNNNGLYMCIASNQYGNGTATMYMHISAGSSTACWSLFSTLVIGLAIFFISKCIFTQRFSKCISQLRERPSGHVPVPDTTGNHRDSSGSVNL